MTPGPGRTVRRTPARQARRRRRAGRPGWPERLPQERKKAALRDIDLRLRGVADLPEGAGPAVFMKDFGDTAALMLTVASPPVSEVEADLRSREVARVMAELRGRAGAGRADGREKR